MSRNSYIESLVYFHFRSFDHCVVVEVFFLTAATGKWYAKKGDIATHGKSKIFFVLIAINPNIPKILCCTFRRKTSNFSGPESFLGTSTNISSTTPEKILGFFLLLLKLHFDWGFWTMEVHQSGFEKGAGKASP